MTSWAVSNKLSMRVTDALNKRMKLPPKTVIKPVKKMLQPQKL